jgi:hypothetical protein
VSELVRSSFANHVRKLGLGANFFVERAAPLRAFEGTRWPALRALKLVGNRIDAATLRVVLGAQMPALSTLLLDDNKLGADGVAEIPATTLDCLDVSRNGIGLEGTRHLASFTSLRALRACGNRLGPKAAKALVAGAWPRLEFLDLEGNSLAESGMGVLAESKHLRLDAVSGASHAWFVRRHAADGTS